MDAAMDIVHENSVSAISILQQRFQQQQQLMFMVSTLFDPRYAFLFYAPLVFALDRYTGRKLMWVAVVAEWSNQVLKWMLHGERPYWWIHETNVYNRTGGPTLPRFQQYSITCETGPGSPSGHAMVTASVFYILIEALLRQKGALTRSKSTIINRIFWSIYTFILCVVSLSRVYIAAHFPHQCVLGMAIGVAVAMMISHINTDNVSKSKYVWGSLGLFLSAMATYYALTMMGMNPMWSVDRAVKWCVKPEYIHLDTTPFFSMMRYTGFFLGMGLGLHSQTYAIASKVHVTNGMKIASALLGLGVAKASEYAPMYRESIYLFYAQAFLLNALVPYLFVALVPYIVSKFGERKSEKRKAY